MNAKTTANRQLTKLPTYQDSISLGEIFDIVKSVGFYPVQEDGTSWSGILCGETGHTTFHMLGTKSVLVLDWYAMPSGRIEINVYLS